MYVLVFDDISKDKWVNLVYLLNRCSSTELSGWCLLVIKCCLNWAEIWVFPNTCEGQESLYCVMQRERAGTAVLMYCKALRLYLLVVVFPKPEGAFVAVCVEKDLHI